MALYIPPDRKPGDLDGVSDFSRRHDDKKYPGPRRGARWSDSDVRHKLYMEMQRGDYGKLSNDQFVGIQRIIDEARGADHELEPSKVLAAIHKLEKSRIELGLDPAVLGSIVASLSHGPEE